MTVQRIRELPAVCVPSGRANVQPSVPVMVCGVIAMRHGPSGAGSAEQFPLSVPAVSAIFRPIGASRPPGPSVNHKEPEMSGMLKPFGMLAAVAAFGVVDPGTGRRPDRDRSHLHEGHRADLPEQVRSLSPARFDRADVARHFEESRPWARSIKNRVQARQMPPWHIDKTIGIQEFKNDRSLSDKEIDTIVKWVDAGAPKGDPKDMPPAKAVAERAGLELRQAVRPDRARPGRSSRCRGRRRPARTTRGGSPSSRPASPSRAGCAPSRSAPAP